MKGAQKEQLWFAILICAVIVAFPMFMTSFSRVGILNRAVKQGVVGKVKTMLNAHPELVHATDKLGATPLHWAVICDRPDIAKLLLARGADVNAVDDYGMTPLHKASSFNRKAMSELLISKGADMDARGVKYRVFRMNPLHLAAEAGFSGVAEVLLSAGADVNARTDGTNSVTCLHMAASRGHLNMARLLLENGAEVNAKDSNDATPLYWATKSGQDKIAELLRVYGGRE